MTRPMDYAATAASMTDVQFELLLRARLRLEAARLAPLEKSVTMTFGATFDSIGNLDTGRWSVSVGWSDSTKGERLAPVVAECLRREGWAASGEAGLLLLEGGEQ